MGAELERERIASEYQLSPWLMGEEEKEQAGHEGEWGRRMEERFGGRVAAASRICFRDKKCVLPCYLQGLVRQFTICRWLAAGASELEQLKKTVLQPSREWREGEGADLLPQPKGDKNFPVTKKKYFSPGTQEAPSNYSDFFKAELAPRPLCECGSLSGRW